MSLLLFRLLSAMSLLSLFGCSRPVQEMPASLADLRIEIILEDRSDRRGSGTDDSHTGITAVVRQADGKAIERDDLAIEVNDVPLKFHVRVGNTYDRYPFYHLAPEASLRVTPATEYRFTLVLPNGSRHEIGTVRTPAALAMSQFDFPRVRPASGPVILAWRDLAETAQVCIHRSERRREADGTVVYVAGSASDPAALRRTIGPGWLRSRSANWTLSAHDLGSSADGELDALGVEITVTQDGALSHTFSRKSSLRAIRRISLRMECPETSATASATD